MLFILQVSILSEQTKILPRNPTEHSSETRWQEDGGFPFSSSNSNVVARRNFGLEIRSFVRTEFVYDLCPLHPSPDEKKKKKKIMTRVMWGYSVLLVEICQ